MTQKVMIDMLQLAKDQSTIVSWVAQCSQTEKKLRLAKLSRLQAQLQTGRTLTDAFMFNNCHIVHADKPSQLDRDCAAFFKRTQSPLDRSVYSISFVDCNKYGRMTTDQLDCMIERIRTSAGALNIASSCGAVLLPTQRQLNS